jgi:hypothetical protein
MDGDQVLQCINCKCAGKPYAGQVAPILRGTNKMEPVIKHPCDVNTLAALKRGLECVTQPEAKYVPRIHHHFVLLAKQVTQYILDEGGLIVDGQVWLSHHPQEYRDKIMRRVNEIKPSQNDREHGIFPKVEMQMEEDAKERCIYGPADIMKYLTGPFMHALEGVMHRNHFSYCGKKNWTQIAKCMDEMHENYRRKGEDTIDLEADFSRYDSTQKEAILRGFALFVEYVIDNAIIQWGIDMQPDRIKYYVNQAIELHLDAFRGKVKAKVSSRASGDTWTTLANTITSIVLWAVTLENFGFNWNLDGHRQKMLPISMIFKGDDSYGTMRIRDLPLFNDAVKAAFNTDNNVQPHGVGCIVKMVLSGPTTERSFLSTNIFERSGGGLRLTRIAERVLKTNPYSTKLLPGMKGMDLLAKELCYAKGMSLKAWADGLPIFGKLGDKMVQLGHPTNRLAVDFREYTHVDAQRICDDVRAADYADYADWLYTRYDITMQDIESIESAIDAIKTPLDEVIHPALDRILGC